MTDIVIHAATRQVESRPCIVVQPVAGDIVAACTGKIDTVFVLRHRILLHGIIARGIQIYAILRVYFRGVAHQRVIARRVQIYTVVVPRNVVT